MRQEEQVVEVAHILQQGEGDDGGHPQGDGGQAGLKGTFILANYWHELNVFFYLNVCHLI